MEFEDDDLFCVKLVWLDFASQAIRMKAVS